MKLSNLINYNFKVTIFQRNLLIVLLLVIAVSYSFSAIFFGLDFTDSFYHLNQALNPANGIYLYPFFLSSVIIKGIFERIGPEIIYLRMINWILLYGSMLLPFFFLKVERTRLIILLYFALAFILYTPFNANILGYDTLSIFINSLLFSVTALYLKSGKFYLIIILSIIGAAAILIRLPNILAIPIVVCVLIISKESNQNWKVKRIIVPGLFVILSFLIVFAGYSLYYDSLTQFFVATSNAESHNFNFLFLNYLKDGLKLAGFVSLILLGFLGYRNFLSNRIPILKYGILILFFILCLSFFVGYSKFSVNYVLFLVALAITFTLIQIYYGSKDKLSERLDGQLMLYLFLFFLFINPFGSNTGLLKSYSLLLLVPFVLSISEIKEKKYWLIIVAVLIPFSVLTMIFGIYEDKNMYSLNEKLQMEKLSPIYTNRERKELLQETDIVVQQLKTQGVEVFFYGDKSHIFHYLYPETFLNISSFFQPVNDPGVFKKIEDVLHGKELVAVFVVDSYPENSPSPAKSIEQEMIDKGFKKVENASVKYYLRTSNK